MNYVKGQAVWVIMGSNSTNLAYIEKCKVDEVMNYRDGSQRLYMTTVKEKFKFQCDESHVYTDKQAAVEYLAKDYQEHIEFHRGEVNKFQDALNKLKGEL